MKKYIVKLRRGKKITNADGIVIQDDWAKYTAEQPEKAIPQEGELVLEYDNGVPRLKIGDGIHTFAELEYMSVDSFILPTKTNVILRGAEWKLETDEDGNFLGRYKQEVIVNNATITEYSKVDLTPDAMQLKIFAEKSVTFVAENENAKITVYCVGEKPENDYKIDCVITEVTTNA